MTWFNLFLAFCAGFCAGTSFIVWFLSRAEDDFEDDGEWLEIDYGEEVNNDSTGSTEEANP